MLPCVFVYSVVVGQLDNTKSFPAIFVRPCRIMYTSAMERSHQIVPFDSILTTAATAYCNHERQTFGNI